MEQKPENGCGQKCNQQIENESSRLGLACETGDHAGKTHPVLPAHRKYGGQLDHDFEYLTLVVVESEQVTDDDQMPRTGNRQEFGKPSTTPRTALR